MSTCISDADWEQFLEDGFLRIENVLSKVELEALIKRIDDIMMGKIQYGDKLLMQLDPTTNKNGEELDYEKQNVEISGQTVGWKGATRMYRKIGEAGAGLECDDLFASFMKKSIFRDICSRAYGPHTKISVYRAMLFNKPAHFKKCGGGMPLYIFITNFKKNISYTILYLIFFFYKSSKHVLTIYALSSRWG